MLAGWVLLTSLCLQFLDVFKFTEKLSGKYRKGSYAQNLQVLTSSTS